MKDMPINPDKIRELCYDNHVPGCEVTEIDIIAALIDKYDKWTTRETCALQGGRR